MSVLDKRNLNRRDAEIFKVKKEWRGFKFPFHSFFFSLRLRDSAVNESLI
jgi:hypothetical protein